DRVRGRRLWRPRAGRRDVCGGRAGGRPLPVTFPGESGLRVDRRVWAILALVVAVGVAFWLRGPSTGDSPEHRSDSDAANGTSALPRLASALGRQTTTLDGSFHLSPGLVELFVFTPTRGFGPGDAARLSGWVRGGGVLVYAAETGDPGLDFSLGVRRGQLPVSGDATGTGPMLAG